MLMRDTVLRIEYNVVHVLRNNIHHAHKQVNRKELLKHDNFEKYIEKILYKLRPKEEGRRSEAFEHT